MKPGQRFPKLNTAVAAWLVVLFVVGVACERNGAESATETPTPVAAPPTSSPTSPPAESPTPTPTQPPRPAATPTPAPLTGAEIFARVSPNVPIVSTDVSLGSGVLIPGGFIVTNAHVVWGFDEVLVKFPGSRAHWTLPVVGLDLMADIAVVGPVRTALEGLALQDGEGLAIGSDVYLIGYPDEVGLSPDEPTITRGVISRFRQWRTLGLTLIQSDAVAAGGQSGGVMVSENGEVIGITTSTFGDGEFIIATSTKDIRERVNGLIEGKDVDGLGDRRLPASRGTSKHRFRLTDRWDSKIAVLYEPPDTEIEIRLESETDSTFDVVDVFAEVILEVDDTETGIESGSTTLETHGPHFVIFRQFPLESGEFALEASHNLIFIDDRDDHRRVSVNESVVGNVDAPFDEDYFELQLDAGESVTISVESFMMNPYVRVARADWTRAAVSDDNGGGGAIGHDAFVSFTAPESGTYIVLVSDSWDNEVGGYFLKIDGAPRQAVSPTPTETPTIPPVASPHGPMATYYNVEYDFSIQYPADWTESKPDDGYTTRLESGDGGFLTIEIEELTGVAIDDSALADYFDRMVSWIESDEQQGKVFASAEYGFIKGKPAWILSYTVGEFDGSKVIFFSERGIAYIATFDFYDPPTQTLARMVEYSFGTIAVGGQRLTRLTDVAEFPQVETESSDSPAAAPESAHEPIWFVPMATYRDEQFNVSIQHPADWEQIGRGGGSAYFLNKALDTFFMQIWVDNLPKAKDRDGTGFDELVDEWRFNFESNSAHRIISSMRFGELNGLPAQLLVSEVLESSDFGITLLCFSEDGDLYQILFVTDAAVLNEVAPILEYSFRSITIDGNPLVDAPEFPLFETASSSSTSPSPDSADARGRFMPMATYNHDEYSFSIQYPAEWKAEEDEDSGVQISSAEDDAIELSFADRRKAGLGDLTLDQNVDGLLSSLESSDAPEDVKPRLVWTSRFGQIAGRPAHLLVLNNRKTDEIAVYFFYIDEGGVLFQVLTFLHTAQREDLQQIVDYSLRSITIDGNPLTDAPQFPSFETISSGSTIQLTEPARGPPRFVLMSTYSHDEYPFTIQYPADWITEEAEDVGARFLSGKDDALYFLPIGRADDGSDELTLDQHLDEFLSTFESENIGYQIVSTSRFGQIGGLPVNLVIILHRETRDIHVYLSHVDDGGVFYQAVFFLRAPNLEDLQQIVEYSLRSITIDGNPLTDTPEFPSLVAISSSGAVQSTESAPERFRFTPMAMYSSDEYPVTIQYPADWKSSDDTDTGAQFHSDNDDILTLFLEDRGEVALGDSALDQIVDDLLSSLGPEGVGHEVVSSSRFGEVGGLPAHLTILIDPETDRRYVYLLHVDKDGVFYLAVFSLNASNLEDLLQTVDYSLRSLTIDGTPLTGAPEFPSLDAASPDEAQPSAESALIQSPFGPMSTYRDDEFAFSIQYPADWEVLPEDDDWKARFLGGEGAAFGIGIQDFGDETPVSLTPEQHHELITDVIIEHWLPAGSGHRILSVSKFGEIDGRPLHVALVTTSDGRENIAVLTYLSATGVSYRVVCEMPASGLDELVPMFDYLIRSIAINGNPLTDAPQFPSFETDSSDDAQPSPESSQIQSPFGPMSTYRDHEFGFVMQYPTDWEEQTDRKSLDAHFINETRDTLGISIEDHSGLGFSTPDQYIDQILFKWYTVNNGFRVLYNSDFGHVDGRLAKLLVFADNVDAIRLIQLVYVSAESTVYTVSLGSLTPRFEELVPMFHYLLRSITINGKPLTDTPEFPSLDTVPSGDTQPSPESSEVPSPYGPMAIYRDDEFGFSMQYPAAWEVVPEDDEWKAQFISDVGNVLAISIIDGRKAGVSDWNAYIYAAEVIAYYESRGGGARAISNLRYGKINGRPARLIIFSDAGSLGATLLYVSGGSVLYGISFALDASRFDDLTPMFDYLFRTITIDGEPLTDTREFPRLG